VLKFKFLAKRMSYAKVNCSHLNPDVKRLMSFAACQESFPEGAKLAQKLEVGTLKTLPQRNI